MHAGSLVALDGAGSVLFSLGEPDEPCYPRSAVKPLQALAMLESGLELDGELLALVAASHSGEGFHLDGVRAILAGADLDESALQTPPDLPLGAAARVAWLRAGRAPSPVAMNCSGKHAGMLATCVGAGWPTASYRNLDAPLQQGVRQTLEQYADERVDGSGVDGCGAPLYALSLTGLTRAISRMATARTGAPARVADAIRHHPQWLGGTGRDVTALLRAVPGLVAKDGAEGVFVAGLPDGRAVALKIADGAERARMPVLIAALRRLAVDVVGIDDLASPPVLGHGQRVGEIRAVAAVSGLPG